MKQKISCNPLEFILEVSPLVSERCLKEQYRLKAWELHPDVSLLPDAQARFAELKQVWDNHEIRESSSLAREYEWADAKLLKALYAREASDRIRAGMVRRIAHLSGWDSLPFIIGTLEEASEAEFWAALHASIRLEAKTALYPILARYSRLSRGLRYAVLRYAQTVDQFRSPELNRLLEHDADAEIRSLYLSKQRQETGLSGDSAQRQAVYFGSPVYS